MLQSVCKNGCVPTRAVVAIMFFTSCFFNYMVRVNMSINIIAMVEPKSGDKHGNVAECIVLNNNASISNSSETLSKMTALPDYGVRYDWDSATQGFILGSYFWGYIISSIPGGYLAEQFSPMKTIGISGLISGVFTILTPLAASWHHIAVMVVRLIIGLSGGVLFPSLHCLVSRWAPPDEKGKFTGALFGGTLGTMVTWPLSGALIDTWGWKWAFIIEGGMMLVWCCLWVLLVTDSPDSHPRISEDERLYIAKCIGDNVAKKKTAAPYLRIFTSIPFWALNILHFGNNWGLYLLLTGGPKFLSEALGFNLGNSGALAALPYLARMICGFVFGFIGDVIRRNKWISVTLTRKFFVSISHVIPGLLLYAVLLVGCDPMWCVLLLIFSTGLNGAATMTNLQNNQDLSPNFAGSVYGIINCFGSTTGFFTPVITGYITSEHSGLHEWHKIFSIGASIYIATGIVFYIFGSGEQQPWNQTSTKQDAPAGVENPAFENADTPVATSESTENTKV